MGSESCFGEQAKAWGGFAVQLVFDRDFGRVGRRIGGHDQATRLSTAAHAVGRAGSSECSEWLPTVLCHSDALADHGKLLAGDLRDSEKWRGSLFCGSLSQYHPHLDATRWKRSTSP